jgi:hypothetical protein
MKLPGFAECMEIFNSPKIAQDFEGNNPRLGAQTGIDFGRRR